MVRDLVVECLRDLSRLSIAKGIYTTTPMFSPRPKDSIPTDGPARGATEGQPHAPDSMRPDAVAARAHCSPPSTQGAPNDQTTVQQDRLRRATTPSVATRPCPICISLGVLGPAHQNSGSRLNSIVRVRARTPSAPGGVRIRNHPVRVCPGALGGKPRAP